MKMIMKESGDAGEMYTFRKADSKVSERKQNARD